MNEQKFDLFPVCLISRSLPLVYHFHVMSKVKLLFYPDCSFKLGAYQVHFRLFLAYVFRQRELNGLVLSNLAVLGLARTKKQYTVEFLSNINPLFFSLLPDEAYDLDFYYEQAEDYPVDLYYLMDLSKYVFITCFYKS